MGVSKRNVWLGRKVRALREINFTRRPAKDESCAKKISKETKSEIVYFNILLKKEADKKNCKVSDEIRSKINVTSTNFA